MPATTAPADLKQRTIRGGAARVLAQAANFGLRLGSLMVLARLLDPTDFGLVGMVTAVIGVLHLFKDFGLSTATVQRTTITEEQISTLFWVNLLVGVILALVALGLAPVVSTFYHEPRLLPVTAVLASGFLVNAAGVQHSALLQRDMRFTAASVIDIAALAVGVACGVTMALTGHGYWSLVAMTLVTTAVTTLSLWAATRWIPGRPRRRIGVLSMVRFGGTITLNSLVVYVAYNLEKVLLGRYWGADALGIYGRGYQLVNIPTENLNSSVGGVAFAALSRLQDDPQRFRTYFLKGYSIVLAFTLPITVVCTLYADELIAVLLGDKWKAVVPVFRLLAPTILIFAMINPFAWLLFSVGLVGRSLRIALVIAPLVITGYVLGLPYGPTGIAFGYSAAMTLWVIPHILWCLRGTVISVRDVAVTVGRPMLSSVAAASLPVGLKMALGPALPALPSLALGAGLFLVTYVAVLWYVMGQRELYLGLLRDLLGRPSARTTPGEGDQVAG